MNMLQCDSCHHLVPDDSTAKEYDYHEIWIDRSQNYHLCGMCYRVFMKDILNREWNEEEGQWKENADQ